ncbi:ParA family protein [Streptosporangium canum]|uniref:ParA family protein n=1 Tax=Streptosporangium canum TaxID=324952 RepID=UPI0036B0EB79
MRTTSRNGLSPMQVALQIRPKLSRVLLVLNNKGGAGKTTTAANFGANMAAALVENGSEERVLILDLDPQGNLGLDLGYQTKEGDDEGASIVQVIQGLGKFNIISDVRPQLDVIPGGRQLRGIAGTVFSAMQSNPRRDVRLALAEALAEIADKYAWIVIDCPPNIIELQGMAAVAGRFVLIPLCFDAGAIQGMEGVSDVFEYSSDLNDRLEPLGVLLFGFDRTNNFRKIKNETGEVVGLKEIGFLASKRKEVENLLAGQGLDIPILKTVVTRAVNVADQCRKLGRVYFELADATARSDWRAFARQSGLSVSMADSAETSAYEMDQITAEIVTLARELEDVA